MRYGKWLKLWRDESVSFAQLPLVARGLFCEILKMADEDGRIDVGDSEPAKVIARHLGADTSDRRALRKHLPLLLEDGCLVHEGDVLHVPGWETFQRGKPRSGAAPGARPWLRLWRRESGSFAQLPLVARGLFCEILKLTDEDGRIHIGDREPTKAVARALGAADRSDVRALRKHLPLLLEDGCLVHEGPVLRFPGWETFQDDGPHRTNGTPENASQGHHGTAAEAPSTPHDDVPNDSAMGPAQCHERAASRPRACRESAVTLPRVGHESATSQSRACHEIFAKCPKSHSRAYRMRIRPEVDQKHTPQTPHRGAVRVSSLSGLPDPLGELESISSEEFVMRAFDAAGRKIGMAPPPRRPQDRARAQELERWALELAPIVAERREMRVEAAFCRLLEVAFDIHKEEYTKAEKARRAGKPAKTIEWRLGWVASRWERYTKDAVAW